MLLYNTLTEKKEALGKSKGRPLRLFVCGPTVYGEAQIGNARTSLNFDIMVRYLRSQKWRITYLQNITDIDDKIIDKARKQKENPLRLAGRFEKSYIKSMKTLGIDTVDTYARASDYIPRIIKQIKTLIKKGYAYKIEKSGYYFDIKKFKDYGKLSKRTAAQAEDGISRIDESIGKRNKGDFALWKFVEVPTNKKPRKKPALVNGEPAWHTSLGWGRPGWHIEDTAITEKHFGPQYDLHGGGMDLKFPHHEAEIAQQESASGKKPFVKIWLHTGFLTVNGKKMSKSAGNFITIDTFIKHHKPEELRWIVASHHYRSPINYTESTVQDAVQSLQAIQEYINRLSFRASSKQKSGKVKKQNRDNPTKETTKKFHESMENDFNTPQALAAIFELINQTQSNIWYLSSAQAKNIIKTLTQSLTTLGFNVKPIPTPQNIKKIAQERELSRTNKQFTQADALRKKIEALGYRVEDTPLGPLCLKQTQKSHHKT
jgi:cysteinyl-tRNA synthetase